MKKSGQAKSPNSSRSGGLAGEATQQRRGADSISSNTQRTRGSAARTEGFDSASKPQRAATTRGTGSKSGGGAG